MGDEGGFIRGGRRIENQDASEPVSLEFVRALQLFFCTSDG
jgi:hypothetical protein